MAYIATRVRNDRAAMRNDINDIEGKIAEVENQLSTCEIDDYLPLQRRLNALIIKRTSMSQRLTNINRYWTNQQSYEPNISIAR